MENKSYKVLARKYRPQKLSEIIGQEETCKIIRGSIKLNRLPHAFLFSGTRGVGKTTIARIISKIVNCEKIDLSNPEPCGECTSCISITKEKNMDVVEIDAASRTGVADVREIIENISYKAVEVKKKIYIIDEVHMLSKAAFNALLKTLEEPPEDIIFIFATTETDKIPVTIMSRCQKFELRRIDSSRMSDFLIEVSKKEDFELGEKSALLISQASEGSVRDALSILDNVLSRGTPILLDTVKEVLGLSDNNLVIDLFEYLCEGNINKALLKFEEIYTKGASLDILAKMLMNICFHTIKLKSGLEKQSFIFDSNVLERVEVISNKYQIVFLTRFWELLQKYVSEIQSSFDEKQCFEMTIMRLCYVSLLPTPFEVLQENSKKEYNSTNNEIINKKESQKQKTNYKDFENIDNLARNLNFQSDKSSSQDIISFDSQIKKFKTLTNLIESESEMQTAYHLRNSFKLNSLAEINSEKKIGEIELESINKKIDSKNILWNATKIIEKKTGQRWIFSLSSKKGKKSISEYDKEKDIEVINEIKKNEIIKKILEIIPSSEIVSVKKLNKNN
ncbi:MAG: DNA polymerase III subunit gamma/tau [Alphaproteobacteria bacterium]